jgi:hypothetical protein
MAATNVNQTSRQLIRAFVSANLLFLIVSFWLVSQQFFPVIRENPTAEFFQIQNYDGDRFNNNTFFAAVSSLRLILNNVK